MQIKKGDLIALTTGEYSDYYLMGTVRALKDFDQRELVSAFVAQSDLEFTEMTRYKSTEVVGYSTKSFDAPTDKFIAWLNREGYIEDCDVVTEWWLGGFRDVTLPE